MNYWSPIRPFALGELVTVDRHEEFFIGRSRRTVCPGDILVVTRMKEGIITAVLRAEEELHPNHIDHPTFVRIPQDR